MGVCVGGITCKIYLSVLFSEQVREYGAGIKSDIEHIERVLGRATPITTAAPGWVSLADVSWLPWLSAPPLLRTQRRGENAALCATKDRNQPVQRLHRQKQQQEGK